MRRDDAFDVLELRAARNAEADPRPSRQQICPRIDGSGGCRRPARMFELERHMINDQPMDMDRIDHTVKVGRDRSLGGP